MVSLPICKHKVLACTAVLGLSWTHMYTDELSHVCVCVCGVCHRERRGEKERERGRLVFFHLLVKDVTGISTQWCVGLLRAGSTNRAEPRNARCGAHLVTSLFAQLQGDSLFIPQLPSCFLTLFYFSFKLK